MKKRLQQHLFMLTKFTLYGFFLQCLLTSTLFAIDGNAQIPSVREVFIDMDVKEMRIDKVLDAIEKQTQFSFVYSSKELDGSQKVTIAVKNAAVSDILIELSRQARIKFKQVNRNISIQRMAAKEKPVETIETSFLLLPVRGKVTDENGAGLPGVNVMIKGASGLGTVTDLEGNYNLSVPDEYENGTLVFSFIGYLNEEVPINNRSVIDIQLTQDIAQLSEVVVVGYGTQKRSDITGSVASVPKDRLQNLPVTDITQAIQGTTAGLSISQGSSVPGSEGSMSIRGVNSINANTDPFIVLDGTPFFGSINDINTNDVESIEILKDASAVAIYGTRGANGVILITTKRGKTGKPRINYNAYTGIEGFSHKLEPMSPERYVQKYADFLAARGETQDRVLPNQAEIDNYNEGETTDWLDEVSQTGRITDHNLSISGGTEDLQYFVGGGYLKQEGIIKGFQFERASIRTNIDARINDFLKVGTSLYYANKNSDGGRANFLLATAMSPYTDVYDENGNYLLFPMEPERLFVSPMLGLTTDRLRRDNYLTGNIYTEVTPTFLEGLKYRLNASYILEDGRDAGYTGRLANDNNGTAYDANEETKNWVVENILSYTKDFGQHHLDITALYSAQESNYFWSEARAVGFVNDNLSYYKLDAGNTRTSDSRGNRSGLLSQMGRINYSYDSRYLMTVTGRRDGYSAFGVNTSKYAFFPSVALGWNIANEGFLENSNAVSNLKLRLSYGKAGNMAIGINQTLSRANTNRMAFGGQTFVGAVANPMLGNADLSWETTTSANIGLDFGFLRNRIHGTLEVYRNTTNDLLMRRNLPRATGYADVYQNLGSLRNSGIELTLNTVNIDAGKFRWETNFNITSNRNELLEIYGDGQDDIANRWFIGEPLQAVFDYKMIGVWQEGDEDIPAGFEPGYLRFEDQEVDGVRDGVINAEDRVILGSELPKWYGGLTNTFHYGNFHLSVFLQTARGVLRNNRDITFADEAGRRNIPAEVGYWTPENRSNEWPSLKYTNTFGYGYPMDASYLRIKDVRLSYTVPQSFLDRFSVSGLTLYAAGRNLYTFTDWIGWDPENEQISRGSENWETNYPLVRTISFGLNLTL